MVTFLWGFDQRSLNPHFTFPFGTVSLGPRFYFPFTPRARVTGEQALQRLNSRHVTSSSPGELLARTPASVGICPAQTGGGIGLKQVRCSCRGCMSFRCISQADCQASRESSWLAVGALGQCRAAIHASSLHVLKSTVKTVDSVG